METDFPTSTRLSSNWFLVTSNRFLNHETCRIIRPHSEREISMTITGKVLFILTNIMGTPYIRFGSVRFIRILTAADISLIL